MKIIYQELEPITPSNFEILLEGCAYCLLIISICFVVLLASKFYVYKKRQYQQYDKTFKNSNDIYVKLIEIEKQLDKLNKNNDNKENI